MLEQLGERPVFDLMHVKNLPLSADRDPGLAR